MGQEKHVVVFTSEGITVKEERKAPLSRETRFETVDDLDWDNFPIDNLTMEVTGIWPIQGDDGETLEKLEFEVKRLERTSDSGTESGTGPFWKAVEEETGIILDNGKVSMDGYDEPSKCLEAFVEFLFANDHLSKADLPIESGWNRYLINTEPVHQRGSRMMEPVEIVDGVHLETKYSKDDIREKILDLATQNIEIDDQEASETGFRDDDDQASRV